MRIPFIAAALFQNRRLNFFNIVLLAVNHIDVSLVKWLSGMLHHVHLLRPLRCDVFVFNFEYVPQLEVIQARLRHQSVHSRRWRRAEPGSVESLTCGIKVTSFDTLRDASS